MSDDRLRCTSCRVKKQHRDFYASFSDINSTGRMTICKICLRKLMDVNDLETIKNALRQVDRPFIQDMWDSAVASPTDTIGAYMRLLGLPQNRPLTWEDSEFAEEEKKEDEEEYTKEELRKLEDEWGYGYSAKEIGFFERKYDNLVSNYPANTSLHEEALRTYCVYKVKAELATAGGDVRDAKVWADLARKQGDIAKINLDKLSESDLSQGLDGFSELARKVEQAVDIIPVLPKFIEKPQDEIDFAIWCFINYERKLHGLEEVEYSDVYEFYHDKLKEQCERDHELKEMITEVEIDYDGKGSKKKLKTIDLDRIIEERQIEEPNNTFIQHLDKWVDFVSWAR